MSKHDDYLAIEEAERKVKEEEQRLDRAHYQQLEREAEAQRQWEESCRREADFKAEQQRQWERRGSRYDEA